MIKYDHFHMKYSLTIAQNVFLWLLLVITAMNVFHILSHITTDRITLKQTLNKDANVWLNHKTILSKDKY